MKEQLFELDWDYTGWEEINSKREDFEKNSGTFKTWLDPTEYIYQGEWNVSFTSQINILNSKLYQEKREQAFTLRSSRFILNHIVKANEYMVSSEMINLIIDDSIEDCVIAEGEKYSVKINLINFNHKEEIIKYPRFGECDF